MNHSAKNPNLSIVLPCLNEETGLGRCLDEIKAAVGALGLSAEVIVVDNNSTDQSAHIAISAAKHFPEVRLVQEKAAGYGYACLKGFREARGDHIFLADADCTYDFSEIGLFIEKMDQGFDLVVGNRFAKPMAKGAMSVSHRYIGNPFLSFLVRIFFGVRIHDIHCGARMTMRQAFEKMPLYTGGMEFASEMVIQAARHSLRIGEVPISYRVREGVSKLRSVNDGWRHVRFIMLYSPLVLFLLPGVALSIIGIGSLIVLYVTSPSVFGIQLFVHPMFAASLTIVMGYQLVIFALFSKTYAITHLGERSDFFERLFKAVTLEKAVVAGFFLAFVGILIYIFILTSWISSGFSSLDQIKNSIVGLTIVILGVQTVSSSFMLSMLGIKEQKP